MWRVAVGRLSKSFEKKKSPRANDGARHVAWLFVPGYGDGIAIKVIMRLRRNSDARRRLGRLIDSRRTIS
jgi:hypothetical protein